MCGICGKVMRDPAQPVAAGLIERMCAQLEHRGPDDKGSFSGPGIGLGHRRLAIIDLRPEAAQPLTNEDGRLQLVLNGEIYNYRELRTELEKKQHRFRTGTDGEVILHLYEEYRHECLDHLEGMFSFAIWDSRRHELFAARDRAGQKPLYYSPHNGNLTFASEAAALLEDRDIPREVNPRAIFDFLSFGFVPDVPDTRSAFSHVMKLPPAHYLLYREGELKVERYWQLSFAKQSFIGSQDEVAHQLREKLYRSVALCLRADVEVGVFLSGGIDSAVIAAEAGALTDNITAYSVAFEDKDYDESDYARLTAEALGLKQKIIRVKPDVAAFLPGLARHYGEPFADSSCIPTYCISQAAAEHVKVILSGDGGDELFGGYNRYRAYRYQTLLRLAPAFMKNPLLRLGAAWGRKGRRGSRREQAGRFCRTVLQHGHGYPAWIFLLSQGEKLISLSPEFRESIPDFELTSEILISHLMVASQAMEVGERAMAADFNSYLPGDLLAKVDIASMMHGLEVRAPFLDRDLMEYTASLPFAYKICNRTHKYILKRAYRKVLPRPILKRGKMGFAVPLTRYVRGELAELIGDMLRPADAYVRTVFRPGVVDAALSVEEENRDNASFVFALLMLELWHRAFCRGGTGAGEA